jgi:hypothetical protein
MEDIANNLGLFIEFGGSNSEIVLDMKLGDNEDPKKELQK